MDREQVKQEIKQSWRFILKGMTAPAKERVNGETSYICPFCGHGAHGDGLTVNPKSKDGNGLKCFGCGFSGDIIDLYMKQYNKEYSEAVAELSENLHLSIDSGAVASRNEHKETKENKENTAGAEETAKKQAAFKEKMKAYKDAFIGSPAEEYVKSRGISTEIAKRFWLGYAKNILSWSDALIIPVAVETESFVIRNIKNPKAQKHDNRYKKQGKSAIFNKNKLYNANKPIFVVEGELDALSIIEAGANAVAIGSAVNADRFLKVLNEKPPVQMLILALDDDEKGQEAEETIADGLAKMAIPFYRCNPFNGAKDANEALLQDKEAFKQALMDAEKEAAAIKDDIKKELEKAKEDAEQETAEAEKAEYLKTSAAGNIEAFKEKIKENKNAISTGFFNLDNILDGGLYDGLYIIGAISSLGKTTLSLQIMDQIAQQGHDCLIFSLEMSKFELMSKSISRHTYLEADKKADAKTTRGIMTGARYKEYTERTMSIINRSIEKYVSYANHIFIYEGVGNIGVDQIKEAIEQHIKMTGNHPVVLIDYLQILAPYNERYSDKQNTDKAILELKRMSRDYAIPIIGISSFNRDSYKGGNGKVSMTDYKESGAIEYSADVLIGLEFSSAGSKDYDEKEEKKKNPRNVKLVILKQRNGKAWETASFDYHTMFNYYNEL